MNANEPVSVYITNDPFKAELIQNALQSEGIHCELEGGGQAALTAVLDIKVLVRAWDEDRARRIIQAHEH